MIKPSRRVTGQTPPWRDGERDGGTQRFAVCSAGCGFVESATWRYDAMSRFWGRATIRAQYRFDADSCPRCGNAVAVECATCARPLVRPDDERCRGCGTRMPWAVRERIGRRNWRDIENRWSRDGWSFYLVGGDITSLAVDAVVSTDDVDGLMWGNAANAIKLAAGSRVERHSQELGPHRIGSAWDTDVGEFTHVRRIIHVAVSGRDHVPDLGHVRAATRSALDKAEELRQRSVALPAIGSGTSELAMLDCVGTIASEAITWLGEPTPSSVSEVLLVIFEVDQLEAARDVVADLFERYSLGLQLMTLLPLCGKTVSPRGHVPLSGAQWVSSNSTGSTS